MKKILAGSVALLALAAAIPLAATAGSDRGGHDRGPYSITSGHHGEMCHHGGMRHGKGHHRDTGARIRMLELLEIYDADGDGSVTQEEVDRARADRLAEFDADGDGQLSIDEYEQLWLDAMRERMVDRFQSYDDDGDGQVTVDEFAERTAHMVLRRDRNEDGVLDMNDLRRGEQGERRRDSGETGADQQQGETQQQ